MAILQTTKVLTLDYWKFASDITVGDIVFDRHGKPVRVKSVQKYRADRCFEVQFNDGLTIAGDDHLILPLETEKYRKRALEYKGRFKFRRPLLLTKLIDLSQMELNGRISKEYSVPTTGALQLPHQNLPIPPFVFGFWFCNMKKNKLMRPVPGTAKYVHEKFADAGYKVIEVWNSGNGEKYFKTEPTVISHLIPLVPTKIPNNYLLGSEEQRLELLRGILNSKHKIYRPDTGKFLYSNKNKQLVYHVQYLAESLGCRTVMNYNEVDNFYSVRITTKLQLVPNQEVKPIKVRQSWRLVANIQQIEPQGCVHIETDGEDGSFVVGEGFIPCH